MFNLQKQRERKRMSEDTFLKHCYVPGASGSSLTFMSRLLPASAPRVGGARCKGLRGDLPGWSGRARCQPGLWHQKPGSSHLSCPPGDKALYGHPSYRGIRMLNFCTENKACLSPLGLIGVNIKTHLKICCRLLPLRCRAVVSAVH